MKRAQIALVGCLLSSIACGSDSGGDRDTLFRGTLVQGEEATNRLAHELGGGLPGVEICTLGQCTLTESNGSWRIRSGAGRDQEILFTVKGHGADTSFILDIPIRARTVEIEKELHTEFGDHHNDHEDHAGHDHDDDHHDHAHRLKADDHAHSGHDHSDDDHDHHEDINLPRNEQLTVKRVIIDGMNYSDAHAFFEHEDHDDHDHESHEEDHNENHDDEHEHDDHDHADHEEHEDQDDHEDEDHHDHNDHDHGHSH